MENDGSVQTEGLITNIEPESDLTAKITLVPYQEGVYRAERGRIPAFVSNIAADSDRMPALRVVSTVSDETVLQQIGLIITGTAIYVQVVPINIPSAYIEARIRPSGTKESYQPAAILRQSRNSIELIEVEDGVAYDVLLRWNQLGMVPGKWTPFTHTVGRVTQYTSVEWHHGEGAPAEGLGREGDFYLRLDGHTVYRRQKGVWIIVANLSDADAAAWYHGAGTPAKRLGSNGSFYFNTDGAIIYRKIAGSWVLILDIDGTAVTNFWRAGSGVPASSLGNKNDFYFRTDNGHVYEKTDEDTWTFRHDITGPRGPAGIDGRTWHRGATAPSSALGDSGDLYLRTSNNSVYGKSGSTWTLLTSLQGSDGSRWYVGADAPADSLGDEGDWYFNSGAASIYRKTGAATWTFQITISDGSDGSIWHGGTGAPLGSTGVLGDWYFRTDNGYVYEKTGGSSWTFRRDITGPQGPDGIDGATWLQGAGAPASSLGIQHDFYLRTSNNRVYQKTGAATWTLRTDFTGAAGKAGAVWHSGAQAPAGSLGRLNDWYFRTTNATIYKKTSAATWTVQIDINDGEDGSTWYSGAGAPGSGTGVEDDWYFRTGNGFVYQKTGSVSWTFRRDITGPSGKDGTKGLRGIAGIDGKTWFTGSTAPSSALGDNGDLYLRTSNNSVYGKSGSTWTLLTSLQGSDGSRWYVGADAPADSLGDEGDWYFNSGAASIYRKTGAATWTFQITISDGSDGSIWHGGTGAPLGSTGVLGDWYFRTDNGYVYEKTGGSSWTFRRDITGPQGPDGIDGATWLQGEGAPDPSLGIQHDFYLRTSNNRVYQKTGAATWTLRTDFTGAAGKAGAVWHSGAQAPAGSLGRLNDWYFRTTNATIYKKTSAATWTVQIDINDGEDGSTWYSGAGAPGSGTGVEDDWYFRTGNGFVYQKTGSVSWTFRRDITGPSGKDGTKGLRGIAGIDGKTWFTGSTAPSSALGDNGDLYLRTSNKSVYKKAGSSWSLLVDFTGADDATWHNGSGFSCQRHGQNRGLVF